MRSRLNPSDGTHGADVDHPFRLRAAALPFGMALTGFSFVGIALLRIGDRVVAVRNMGKDVGDCEIPSHPCEGFVQNVTASEAPTATACHCCVSSRIRFRTAAMSSGPTSSGSHSRALQVT